MSANFLSEAHHSSHNVRVKVCNINVFGYMFENGFEQQALLSKQSRLMNYFQPECVIELEKKPVSDLKKSVIVQQVMSNMWEAVCPKALIVCAT